MSRSTEEAQAHAALYAHGVLSEKEMQELQDSEEQLTDRSVAETLTTDIKAFEPDSYVLEEEMSVSGMLMRPGDHCRAEPGWVYTGAISRAGYAFIARASLDDEF